MTALINSTYSYFQDIALELGLLTSEDLARYEYTSVRDKSIQYIRLKYVITDIFAEVRKRTTYLAKLRGQNAELLDLVAMTADEDDLFDPFLTETVIDLAEWLNPFTKNIAPGFIFKKDIIIDSTLKKEDIYFFIEKLSWVNNNSIQLVDTRMFEALVLGVMFRWFMMSFPQETQSYQAQYERKKQELAAAANTSNGIKRIYTYP